MSYRKVHHFSFQEPTYDKNTGVNFSQYSNSNLNKLWNNTLEKGVHGLCFSMYEDGQKPGDIITVKQVERRVKIIKPYTKWVRSFSCIEGHEHIPCIAHKNGIKTLVGAWLSDDLQMNEKEIEGLIALAKQGYVDIAAVGNEVLYREDLTEDQLLGYIYRVQDALPDIEVGYVDAYYEFSHRPRITNACNVILANCYPYWEGCHIDDSLNYMKKMYELAKDAGKGKRVIITETGWPSKGGNIRGAFSSELNAMKYFINSQIWCEKDNVDMFYFSSFDESWKTGDEGDVGAYWGLWDKHEKLKF